MNEQRCEIVWLACQDFEYDGWSILGAFSSAEKAEAHIQSYSIVIRPYAGLEGEIDPPQWVIEVSHHLTFIQPGESLAAAIVEADKREHLYVEEWPVDADTEDGG